MNAAVCNILNDMSEVLNIQQMRLLQEALLKYLHDEDGQEEKQFDNMDYLDMFVAAKRIQKLLGHQQIDTTMHYAMVNQNNVKNSHRKYIA